MPSVRVNLPKEMGGAATIKIREGETPEQAIDRRIAGIQSNQEGVQDEATFIEGVGAGLMDTGKSVGNMLGVVDDDTVMRQREIDKGLGGWGKAGKFTGEMLATAPLGMGVGAAVGRGARAFDATSKAGKYLTKTLGRGMGRGAVEGATYGAVMADPNERGAGALGGAALGGALGGAGTMLGKALGKAQFVKTTPEAKRLGRMLRTSNEDDFIPLAQAAEGGLVKNVYEAFLANLPGVSGKIRGQYQKSLDNLRRFAGDNAMPDKLYAHNLVNMTGKENVEQMMGKLNKYWKTAFDPIKQYKIVPNFKGSAPTVNPTVKRIINTQIDEGTVKIPTAGKVLSGDDVITLRNTLNKMMPEDTASQNAVKAYINQLDDMVARNLNPTGKGRTKSAVDLQKYLEAGEYYPNWMALNRAVKGASDNIHFTPKGLASSSFTSPIRAEKGPLQRAGELGTTALRDFPSREGIYQTLAAVGAATSTTGAVLGSTPLMAIAPAVIALGRLGASKKLQQYLMRQTKTQKLGKAMMNKYSKELQSLGFTARQAAEMLTNGEE